MKLIIDIPEEIVRTIRENNVGNFVYKAIKNGTPLTPNVLAEMLMEERIRGTLHFDTDFEKDIIDDVKCRLTVSIIDRRPCYCSAEVWRESGREGEQG